MGKDRPKTETLYAAEGPVVGVTRSIQYIGVDSNEVGFRMDVCGEIADIYLSGAMVQEVFTRAHLDGFKPTDDTMWVKNRDCPLCGSSHHDQQGPSRRG